MALISFAGFQRRRRGLVILGVTLLLSLLLLQSLTTLLSIDRVVIRQDEVTLKFHLDSIRQSVHRYRREQSPASGAFLKNLFKSNPPAAVQYLVNTGYLRESARRNPMAHLGTVTWRYRENLLVNSSFEYDNWGKQQKEDHWWRGNTQNGDGTPNGWDLVNEGTARQRVIVGDNSPPFLVLSAWIRADPGSTGGILNNGFLKLAASDGTELTPAGGFKKINGVGEGEWRRFYTIYDMNNSGLGALTFPATFQVILGKVATDQKDIIFDGVQLEKPAGIQSVVEAFPGIWTEEFEVVSSYSSQFGLTEAMGQSLIDRDIVSGTLLPGSNAMLRGNRYEHW